MAVKNVIASGVGFSPGKVGYIVTRGLGNLGGGGGGSASAGNSGAARRLLMKKK